MVDFEREMAILHQFRDDWRSIGWWAEVTVDETPLAVATYEFRAALFSPKRLNEMLEEDHKDTVAVWNRSSTYLRSEFVPKRPECPSFYYMDEANWSVGSTAIQACGGAIIIAKRRYPTEMPTVKQFKHSVEMSKPF